MCCSASQVGQGLAPGTLLTFAVQELLIALQGPGEYHLRAMLCRSLGCHRYLGMVLVHQVEHMHIRSCRLNRALESNDLQALIPSLQEELCLCSCPFRVCMQHNSSKGLQELGNAQEGLLHAEGLPLHPLGQAP